MRTWGTTLRLYLRGRQLMTTEVEGEGSVHMDRSADAAKMSVGVMLRAAKIAVHALLENPVY
jgi:hypothetical protein